MTSCREKFNNILNFSRKCASFCGADFFNPDYRYTFLTWFVIICTNTFFLLSIYTIYVGVYVDEDWTAILQALCMVGSAVSGLNKLFSGISHQKGYRKLYTKIDGIYQNYEQKRIEYRTALNDTTDLIAKVLKFSAYMYIIGTLIILSVPLFYLIFFGEKIFVMQFLIPGVDPLTHSGHLITICAHTTCILFGSFGNFAGDMFFFIFILHVPLLKNILRLKFEDMNEVALKPRQDEKVSSGSTLPMLLDILEWHQDYTSYTKSVSDMYFGVTLVQVFTTASSIGMTIFITFMGVWPAGYAYLIYLFVILYAYCGLGTVTEISNDHVCDYVYNSCLWYELSVPERKMLITMLIKAQNPTLLTVGNIMPLSVTTALSLTKTIYSFMMMLFNFAES